MSGRGISFAEKFGAELDEIKDWPDKSKINSVTLLAEDAARHPTPGTSAADAVGAIESRLFRPGNPSYKLPLMYVMDSIMFNVGEPYVGLFAKNVRHIFPAVHAVVSDKEQARMRKLIFSWAKRSERRAFSIEILKELKFHCFPEDGEPLPVRPARHPGPVPRAPRPSDNYRRPTPPMAIPGRQQQHQQPPSFLSAHHGQPMPQTNPLADDPVRARMRILLVEMFDQINAPLAQRVSLEQMEAQRRRRCQLQAASC